MCDNSNKGFTLIEILVGAAVFVVIAIAAYNAFVSLSQLIRLDQDRVLAIELADEQFEIARNMPYTNVGVEGSIPSGSIPHIQTLVRGGVTFTVTTIVRNIDLPFDGTAGGVPNDLSPADNKLVQITVSCDTCNNFQNIVLTGQVAPKNLEEASTNGSLFIRVFDANGQPVQNASVHVVNVATTTTIVIDDVTDANGMLQLVDIPPGNNAYRVTVTKTGYSTDRTYPPNDPTNPNPSKPDATVVAQQVTQVSFAIDKLSTLHFSSVTPTCTPVGNFAFNLTGAKQIGQNLPKYSANQTTDAGGTLDLNNMEWDSYTVTPTDSTHYLTGVNPLNPVALNPGSSQNIQLIVVPQDSNALLVTVKDSSTGLPLTGAAVELAGPGGYDKTLTTGQGFLSQTDWSGGPGQVDFTDNTKYFADDGNVDTSTTSGDIVLRNAFGQYNQSGMLESSTFDTGSASNFFSLIWSPTDQPQLAGPNAVKMQFATNATITPTTTWSFIGPDGTAGSYYISSISSLNAIHNGNEYARYRVYLSTNTATVTPNVSNVAFTYTSACVPSGQVIFTGLATGTYTVTVSKSGYSNFTVAVSVSNGWQEEQVLLGP
ncbi:carboxypeptidase regulatory-like domain-containing protein [Patescibacteria group bacterium]|nr:carboxypeptidase regulatory-like domain-containing protein [Patescibacteria group bacterium]MDE1946689.1 carboxypeptidase regulatory-like domain-containing protein [Patescibacteria group bacterium]MDE2010642.1 carboxypeptidase regulatory-like domain-containing protein [Patescibacteria group bacterium]MDE2233314.1 carboxypeptidase regulatory-like domain-containing protein [Patescibacteria group bacterium]